MEQLMALGCSLPSRQQISWRTVHLLSSSKTLRYSQQTAPLLRAAPLQRRQGKLPTPRVLRQPLQETGRRSATPQRLQETQQQVQEQHQMSSELLPLKWAMHYCGRLPATCSRLQRAGRFPVTQPLPLRVCNPLPGAAPGPLVQRCAGCRCHLLPCGLANQVTADMASGSHERHGAVEALHGKALGVRLGRHTRSPAEVAASSGFDSISGEHVKSSKDCTSAPEAMMSTAAAAAADRRLSGTSVGGGGGAAGPGSERRGAVASPQQLAAELAAEAALAEAQRDEVPHLSLQVVLRPQILGSGITGCRGAVTAVHAVAPETHHLPNDSLFASMCAMPDCSCTQSADY